MRNRKLKNRSWLLAGALLQLLVSVGTARGEPSGPVFAATYLPDSPASPAANTAPGKVRFEQLPEIQIARQFGKLAPKHKAALRKNGFFVAPSNATHLYQIYELNDYLRLPSFVTTDLMIALTHTFMETTVQKLEENELFPRLQKLSQALFDEALKMRRDSKRRQVRRAADHNLFYFGVAARLARLKPKVPKSLRAKVYQASSRLERTGFIRRNRWVTIGGTKLKVETSEIVALLPGRYARTEKLRQYGRVMTWFSTLGGSTRNPQARALRAALALQTMRRAKVGKTPALAWLEQLESVVGMFVGASNRTTLRTLIPQYEQAFGQADTPDALSDKEALATFTRIAAGSSGLTKPPTEAVARRSTPRMGLLGKRELADSMHLRQVALNPGTRLHFSGLDVAAALGSGRALSLLKEHDPAVKSWDGFTAAYEKGVAVMGKAMEKQKNRDLYHGTLHALQAHLPPVVHPDFPAMATPAWQDRSIQAVLAGWAGLRHTFGLYGTLLGAECDHPDLGPPPGVVEPYPELYRRLRLVVERFEARLTATGMMYSQQDEENIYGSGAKMKFLMVKNALSFCERIARKHLAGQRLTRIERKQITTFGGAVERALITMSDSAILSDREKDMALISGVATIGRRVLHAAVGHPDVLYVLARVDGKLTLMRGATMSYYEFLTPLRGRLVDEQWHGVLNAGKEPARPLWFRDIYAPAPPRPPTPERTQNRCASDYTWLEL